MDELHGKQDNGLKIEPEKGQRGFLCSNKEPFRCPFVGSNSALSKETLEALEDLGEVLKSIKKRMYNEGYKVIDGVVQKI